VYADIRGILAGASNKSGVVDDGNFGDLSDYASS